MNMSFGNDNQQRGRIALLEEQVAELESIEEKHRKLNGELRIEIMALRAALERIAKYGEDHIEYINAQIDGLPLSRFARAALFVTPPDAMKVAAVIRIAQDVATQAKHTNCRTDLSGMHAVWLQEGLRELITAVTDLTGEGKP